MERDESTVSNSSRKALFSEAGKDATSAANERRVAWSLVACPNSMYLV